MSTSKVLIDALPMLTDLILDRDLSAARRKINSVMDGAAPIVQTTFGRCVATLEQYPYKTAKARLADAAQNATDPDVRAIIEAFTPPTDPGFYLHPDNAPTESRYGHGNYRAPRDVEPTSRARQYRDQRQGAPRDSRQARKDTKAAKYFTDKDTASRHAVDVTAQPNRREGTTYGTGLDYDGAAVTDVRTLPCVSCWIERANNDTATERVNAGRGDDGLCLNCRETNQPGIPELPAPHTRATAVEARCAYIAQHTGKAAREVLRSEHRRYADPYAKATIEYWVDAFMPKVAPAPVNTDNAPIEAPADAEADPEPTNDTAEPDTDTATAAPMVTPAAEAPPAKTATKRKAPTCNDCGGIRQVRKGQCVDCRNLTSSDKAKPAESADTAGDPNQSERPAA
ncbi:hypothetical protein [Kibdelosporangium phytohabitans]|uniref:Uncharacterized protein n=1 Tax=Kibdelosporangium phytohabitans TaxID=860235 RepID=A0A0N9HW49_9PSEU|nr:hypothetical protein [Kibdelosporangium phytohabitans]ALG06350.1 hypothetical protein AOZ06_04915 [Kibdelosporangium phytohabitans]MBE1467489.1 hypothetical protein [Kibdelosporangium phytohabitans]